MSFVTCAARDTVSGHSRDASTFDHHDGRVDAIASTQIKFKFIFCAESPTSRPFSASDGSRPMFFIYLFACPCGSIKRGNRPWTPRRLRSFRSGIRLLRQPADRPGPDRYGVR